MSVHEPTYQPFDSAGNKYGENVPDKPKLIPRDCPLTCPQFMDNTPHRMHKTAPQPAAHRAGEECPECGGAGEFGIGGHAGEKCKRCGGTGWLTAQPPAAGEYTVRQLLQKYFDKYNPYDGEAEQTLEEIDKIYDARFEAHLADLELALETGDIESDQLTHKLLNDQRQAWYDRGSK